MCVMVESPIDILVDLDLENEDSKYRLRRLCKYAGGSTHVTLTLPTYLVSSVEAWSTSKSLLIAFVIEDFFSRYGALPAKCPALAVAYKYMLAMDRFARKVKSAGGSDRETNRTMRAYKAYFRRLTRVMRRRTLEIAGIESIAVEERYVVPEPRIRLRPDRRRLTDSESARELGKENESEMERLRDDIEARRELFHNDPERFKELFPEDYAEWYGESDSEFEEEVEEPLGN